LYINNSSREVAISIFILHFAKKLSLSTSLKAKSEFRTLDSAIDTSTRRFDTQDLSRFSCAGRGLWVGVRCVYIGIHLPSEKGMWGWGEEEGGNLNPGNPHNGIC
jgi:hypothetical protein